MLIWHPQWITACRVRKQKERYAVTELRKQQNRMNFGEIGENVYQEDLGHNRGNIGKGGVGGGSLRMAQVRRSKIVIQGDKFTWDYKSLTIIELL